MKYLITLVALIGAFFPVSTLAEDFVADSTAKSWNLYAEKKATFEARVVDVLCEVSGDCPTDCGGGTRQMGLVRTSDNVMVLALKNNQAAFSGAAVDLALYCNQTVNVDGLMIEDPDLKSRNVYQVQKVQTGDGAWVKASKFTKVWKAENPDAPGKGPWFRRDPRINAWLAETGYLGLGLDIDAAFIKDWFE